ncbi:50S ribosomal protein L18 [Geopsychrobacter electrodiphilus]|uniref:50S ribosomal protein L18 n=1 Tax=Geopsychrobacter electrodiphilus TaxID=225196 RepID=UPI00036409FE|nr:50S ribosomal protein L18 [Geopsychrobacter electrodiphilus]
MDIAQSRRLARLKRQARVRKKVIGTPGRPRLSVFRSAGHIYAQIIEDTSGHTLVAASTLSKDVASSVKFKGNVEAAKAVGTAIAKQALARNIDTVVFDRNGFLYQGRVQALADAAREAGLKL